MEMAAWPELRDGNFPGAEQLLWGCHTDGILSPVLPMQQNAWGQWDEDKRSAGISGTNSCVSQVL